ncbi:MAG: hypothetical protein AAGM22_17585 [Acidobacteriota bacterium]
MALAIEPDREEEITVDSLAIKGLPLKYQKQRFDDWCWAACYLMVFNQATFIPKIEYQCIFGRKAFGKKCCTQHLDLCKGKKLPLKKIAPNWNFWLRKYNQLGDVKVTASQISFSHLISELASRPVQLLFGKVTSLEPLKGHGHAVMADRYYFEDRPDHEKTICYNDPARGLCHRTFNYLRGSSSWAATWTNIR